MSRETGRAWREGRARSGPGLRRLWASIIVDVRLQWRHGFWAAAAFVVLMMGLFLKPIGGIDWAWLLPPLVMSNLLITTFYFLAGQVLLEKEEGSLESRVVTPLRPGEYLAAKTVTLVALAAVENLALSVLLAGFHVQLLPFLFGVALDGAVLALFGFVAVAGYNSINEFLFPSMIYTVWVSLPIFGYFGLWPGPWWVLHPMQPGLTFLTAAFQPVPAAELVMALVVGVGWVGVTYWWARRRFDRFVLAKAGVGA